MWLSRSHTLAPLIKMTSNKRKFKWTKVKQDNFSETKRTVASNNLCTYLYFNETFKIHTNARAFQLGAFISHKGKPLAFYIRKLTGAQQQYTVTERYLLSTFETLK